MLLDVLGQHRGPYRFMVSRPGTKAGFYTSEWLTGNVDRDDVETESMALLTDPRDTIDVVHVWSVVENQFITTVKR